MERRDQQYSPYGQGGQHDELDDDQRRTLEEVLKDPGFLAGIEEYVQEDIASGRWPAPNDGDLQQHGVASTTSQLWPASHDANASDTGATSFSCNYKQALGGTTSGPQQKIGWSPDMGDMQALGSASGLRNREETSYGLSHGLAAQPGQSQRHHPAPEEDSGNTPSTTVASESNTPGTHKCAWCGAAFPDSDGLQMHASELEHRAFKFPTAKCGMTFTHHSALSEHVQGGSHALATTAIEMSCKVCNARFGSLKKLEEHARSKGHRTFNCPEHGCSSAYDKRESLRSYRSRNHFPSNAKQTSLMDV
jgi:hypothetical protein